MTPPNTPLSRRLDAWRWLAPAGAIVACALALRVPVDPQIWWHLAVGRVLSAFHAVATTNPFTYTAPTDAPVLLQPWIGQFWLHELHALGGLSLIVGLYSLLAGATVALFGAATWRRSRDIVGTTVAAVPVGIVAAWLIPLGPSIFALPLAALCAHACFGSWRRALWLVPIAVLWVNLAPGFAVPAASAAAVAVAKLVWSRDVRGAVPFAAIAVATFAATLLNPRGIETWAALRDGMELVIVSALLVAQQAGLQRRAPRPPRPRHPALSIAVIIVAVAAAVATQPWFMLHAPLATAMHPQSVRGTEPLRGLAPRDLPVEAVEVVRSWGAAPRVFIAPEHAGYYIFRVASATPRRLVWNDPSRLASPATTALIEELRRRPAAMWRGLFQQWEVSAVILDPRRDADLIGAMRTADDWYLVLEDDRQVLFQRRWLQNPPPNRR